MSTSDTPTGVVDEWDIRAGDRRIIHDPDFVPNRSVILAPLADRGLSANAITDVIISHHHPDHTLNIALFENAQTHDVWGCIQERQVARTHG
jgi:glyoxylase-like metal-dependent hydrolase (beta-lactamase superfamily II)